MKTNVFKSALLAIGMATISIGAYSCADEQNESAPVVTPPTPVISNVETEDYFFRGSSCSPQYSKIVADKVYIVSSIEEFQTFVSCVSEETIGIDFDRYSLLFVYGGTTQGVENISKMLQQVSSTEYILNVEVILNMTMVPEGWQVAVLAPKISQNAVIRLNKSIHY